MAVLVCDPWLEDRIRAERKASGADRFDEVWEGVYHMSPLPNTEHQWMVMQLGLALNATVSGRGSVYPGINISDREKNWEQNFRCPDLAVILSGGLARDCGAFHLGGPDLVVEILSPGDRAHEKIPFYGQVGVRELLIIDRDPWALQLHRLEGNALVLAGESALPASPILASAVLPLSFRLIAGPARPQVEVVHSDGVQKWLV